MDGEVSKTTAVTLMPATLVGVAAEAPFTGYPRHPLLGTPTPPESFFNLLYVHSVVHERILGSFPLNFTNI